MSDPNIISFIRDHLTRGVTGEETQEILLAAGWPEAAVKEAFDEVAATQTMLFTQADKMAAERAERDAKAEGERLAARKNRILWKTGIAVVLAFGIAGAAYAYTPTLLLTGTKWRVAQVRAMEYRIKVDADGTMPAAGLTGSFLPKGVSTLNAKPDAAEAPSKVTLAATFDGAFDGSSADDRKARAAFTFDTAADGKHFSIGGEGRFIGKISYLRLDKLALPDAPDLSLVTGRWISIDPDAIKKDFAAFMPQAGGTADASAPPTAPAPAPAKPSPLSAEEMNKVSQVFADHGAYDRKVTKWFDTPVDGEPVMTMESSVNVDKFREALTELRKPEYGFDAESIDRLDKEAAAAKDMTASVSIGWKTFLPRKAVITVTGKPGSADIPEHMTIVMDFPSYGGEVAIVKPADSETTPVVDVVKELFGKLMAEKMKGKGVPVMPTDIVSGQPSGFTLTSKQPTLTP